MLKLWDMATIMSTDPAEKGLRRWAERTKNKGNTINRLLDISVGKLRDLTRINMKDISTVSTLIELSYGGDLIVSAGNDGSIKLWNAETGHVRTVRARKGNSVIIDALAFAPDNKFIVCAMGRNLEIWKLKTKTFEVFSHILPPVSGGVMVLAMAFSTDGNLLYLGLA